MHINYLSASTLIKGEPQVWIVDWMQDVSQEVVWLIRPPRLIFCQTRVKVDIIRFMTYCKAVNNMSLDYISSRCRDSVLDIKEHEFCLQNAVHIVMKSGR